MSQQPPQQNLSLDQYIGQVKQTVFGMTGALSSKIDQIFNDLFRLIDSQQKTLQADKEEIDRLQQLLIANKIDFSKPPPKGVPIGAAAGQKVKTKGK